ncbi:hypothetical protein L6452_27262 [Arctium lappa]|uniref:Uncharacterized protein n=1 Tax=Arctium lappa TaxID=4217 RepID=A0ACB8ZW20_ARCLA|nr:hypothetical protein L6452_27262 [Arctium lappa]
MSSSTVSITANPSSASLRRPLVTGDKKSGLDLAATDGIDASPVSGGENNPTHSIRARVVATETVLERSRDTVQTKNPLPTNSTTKLRKRTVLKKGTVPNSSRPPWKTAASVIVKNLGLLLVLLLLAQMVRRLAFNQGSGYDSILIPSSDYERRIAEVEAFLKTTTKMMQVQVEVVDRKIESEIAGLKTELSKRIDDEGAEFSTRFTELDGRVESMEKSLAATEWLSKDEFDRFLEEFKGKKGIDDVGDLKLDEVRAFAREIVEKEIGKHAADGLGRVDYAVASGGAMVLKHSEAFLGASRVSNWFTGGVRSDAVKMLQPSFGQPGECFPLKGNNGFVEIKLRTAIVPEAITLEHVSKSVAFDRSSAPKDCKVLGWLQNGDDTTEKKHLLTEFTYDLEKSNAQTFNVLLDSNPSMVIDTTEKKHLLTEFTYDLEKSNAQTFNVLDSKPSMVIDTIRLEFMSNHGSLTHTCIYRVRVHGHTHEPNVS